MSLTHKPQLSDQVFNILIHYIKERGLRIPEGGIYLNSELADFGLDSLDEVAIVIELESHFNLALDRKQAVNARHFSDLVALVASAQDSLPKS